MKKNIILLMTAVFGVFVLAGCSEDDLKKTSAVLDSPTVENDFDRWLAKNYWNPTTSISNIVSKMFWATWTTT